MTYSALWQQVQEVNDTNFDQIALDVFRYQVAHNSIYKHYVELLGIHPERVQALHQIPFLPIECFKNFPIQTGDWQAETVFTSSGTSGQQVSKHFVKDLNAYLENTKRGFEVFYGKVENYCVLALLPAYLERQGSSLVAMADYFIRLSKYTESGFFLQDTTILVQILKTCQQQKIPTLLLGVSFALLDLAEEQQLDLSHITIMETGGMKGRRKELIRSELHECLQTAFQVSNIHSEYGMTELLSQAYSKGDGLFKPCPSMRILIRELSDPFSLVKTGRTGGINIIDLANIDSCAFIATQDLGKEQEDGSFEVLGRFDHSDVRGCNLMVDAFK